MSINIKKYTKEQMAQMVEEAQCAQKEAEDTAATYFEDGAKLAEENEKLRGRIAAHIDTINQMNGEAINKANEIANLKAEVQDFRNKLAATETALGRANAEAARLRSLLEKERRDRYNAEQDANWAAAHPWRNLWASFRHKA